jgi:2-methylcitrate dehydratase PrpD
MGETETIAAYVADLEFSAIPEKIRTDIKTLLFDYLGVALGGTQTKSARIAAEFAREMGGKEESSLIGFGSRVAAPHAAFANAISSHSIELDDVDDLAYFHFSSPIYSAALATAERRRTNGRSLLVALSAGCDVMARLSLAMNPSLRDRGFHTTPTCGVFGAAVASARLLDLDAAGITSALGLAGAQASGLMEMYGVSMQKRFNPGPAAWSGVVSALLAQKGFTGAETIIEGERGFLKAYCDRYDKQRLVHDLGKEFPISIEYKAYACARPIHNAVDCALTIKRKHNPDLSGIKCIKMQRHPRWAHYHQIAKPRTYHEAQVSLPYSVAVALVEGNAFLQQYTEEKLQDPMIQKLAALVEFESVDGLPREVSCRMEVEMDSGARLQSQVDYPKGSTQNPLSMDERRAKFGSLAPTFMDSSRQAQVEKMVFALEDLDDVAMLMNVVRGKE